MTLYDIKRAAIRAVVAKHKVKMDGWMTSVGRAQGLRKDPAKVAEHERSLVAGSKRQIERIQRAMTAGELYHTVLSWGKEDDRWGLHHADGDLTELLLKALAGEALVVDPQDDDD